jgi:hypothetical protein
MPLLYDKRENAHKHAVAEGDTLHGIAERYKGQSDHPPDLSWQDLAVFNWATEKPREVLRALYERIGLEEPAGLQIGAAPETLKLNPKFGPAGTKEILIPKLWKTENRDLKKTHTIKVKKHIPASAIAIVSLHKWFLPEYERCDIEYELEGEQARADRVDLEVYGSNYSKLDTWNGGLPTFIELPDVPVFKQTLKDEKATERSRLTIDDWKGEANCGSGMLAKGHSGENRCLNVAFSPYTVVLRYSKKQPSSQDDEKARIELAPFWLEFGQDNKATAESRKIGWTVKGTGRLKFGLLQISTGDGTVVYTKALATGDLAKDAAQEFAWDGKHANGTEASAARMPYRVRIDAHTDIDEAEALAVSAMHTEVRLFVDKLTSPLNISPYVAVNDKISLDISIADLYHKDADPLPGDGKVWTKFALAQAGFHPGPVTDGNTNSHFETALNEFQRSVPKYPRVANSYERLAITAGGNDDNETKTALEHLAQERQRPWFGNPADRSDWNHPPDQNVSTLLRDPTAKMIVWVDDRNWYTDAVYWSNPYWDARPGVDAQVRASVEQDPADLGNLRGGYEDRDQRVQHDERDIARPWIPLQVGFRLLTKANTLDDDVAESNDPTKTAAILKSIGPLRVDWTFDEIEQTAPENVTIGGNAVTLQLPELETEVEATLAGLYHRDRNRTRIALRWALDAMKDTHQRIDVTKQSNYYNAPLDCGGIRPKGNPAQYFSAPFGMDVDSLAPWKAKTSNRESVYCVVHDELGQQADEFFRRRRGLAGIYFHPSRIAGDGYQIRAQVRFEPVGNDYKFPNAEVLMKRYAKLPQAHTAKFRLWRKTSIRGYICWGPTNTWNNPGAHLRAGFPPLGPDGFRAYYTGCHVHITNELGELNPQLDIPVGSLFNNGNFPGMVLNSLPAADPRRARNAVFSPHYAWPWGNDQQLGINEPSGAGLGIWLAHNDLSDRLIFPLWWNYTLRFSLEIVKEIERQKGWMRGHVIVEFQTSPVAFFYQYRCNQCNSLYTFVQNAGTAMLNGNACPTACGGQLFGEPEHVCSYQCTVSGHTFDVPDANAAGGSEAGQPCPSCAGVLTPIQINREAYRCGTCQYQQMYPEPGGRGSHQNDPCPRGCGGTLASTNTPLVLGNWVEHYPPAPLSPSYSCGGVPTPGLPSCASGYPVGVSWNFIRDSDLWGHELGHNRYYEHAGSAPRPANDPNDEQDREVNQVEWPGYAIANTDVDYYNHTWDRSCLMSYITDVRGADPFNVAKDMPVFCYKCVLKNRGWRLNSAAAPVPLAPGDLQDP